MRPEAKEYWYQSGQQLLAKLENVQPKPTLLMHTCCAVCACWPLLYLHRYFDMTLYFNNDNIYPFAEYQRRYDELVRYLKIFNDQYQADVKLVKTPYDGENYLAKIAPLKDEPERGRRCALCYQLRMRSAMAYASQHQFSYFTTVMTVSRQKDSVLLNQIGDRIAADYPTVAYFHSDFKKQGGLEKGDAIAQANGLYRQNYCGCLYSYQDMLKRTAQHNAVLKAISSDNE